LAMRFVWSRLGDHHACARLKPEGFIMVVQLRGKPAYSAVHERTPRPPMTPERRQQQKDEAALAMRDYRALEQATRDKTLRLRALREGRRDAVVPILEPKTPRRRLSSVPVRGSE
jgi:hypothetical protein